VAVPRFQYSTGEVNSRIASRCANNLGRALGELQYDSQYCRYELISDPTATRVPPPSESTGSKIKKALGPIGVIGFVILIHRQIKFYPAISSKRAVHGSEWLAFTRASGLEMGGWFVLFCSCTSADICWCKEIRPGVSAPIHSFMGAFIA